MTTTSALAYAASLATPANTPVVVHQHDESFPESTESDVSNTSEVAVPYTSKTMSLPSVAHADSGIQATPSTRVKFSHNNVDISLLVEEDVSDDDERDRTVAFDVKAWLDRFAIDFRTVYYALKALCLLAEANSAPELQQYRHLLDSRGMLKDTELPAGLIRHYRFTEVELNDVRNVHGDDTERGRVLALLHQMGETKTCLRYILALMDNKRQDLLQQYLTKVRESIVS